MSSESASSETQDYTEHVETPLNACSLETLPHPIRTSQDRLVWPMMMGCYELDESQGRRQGHLDFYTVPVPEAPDTFVQGLGAPTTIFGTDEGQRTASGILDGKFAPRGSSTAGETTPILYATAHATGEIQVHQIILDSNESDSPLRVETVGTTSETDDGALCLAISWDLKRDSHSSQRLISSYSKGKVAIHELGWATPPSSLPLSSIGTISMEEVLSWDAHKMFHSPAEVWCASFSTTHEQIVLSGGDEGQLKIWDLRMGTHQPIHSLKHFEAGVTVLAPHPTEEHIIACGSYDETIAILDLRLVSELKPKPLVHSEPLGGGMWRMKWHPTRTNRLLLGAMHGGCRVVDIENLQSRENNSLGINVRQSFTRHKSMAYGADWLAYQAPSDKKLIEAAASCSFYDRAMYLWNTVS